MRVFLLLTAFFLWATSHVMGQITTFPTVQTFDESFSIGSNVTFLPQWWANEVRPSGSRIFQMERPSGNKVLTAIATSSFVPEMRYLVDFSSIRHPLLVFKAASDKNGSVSTRPALVRLSWSTDAGLSFSEALTIGEPTGFQNEAFTGFREFIIRLPDSLTSHPEVQLRWSIERGEGSGSVAKWLLDSVVVSDAGPSLVEVQASSDSTLRVCFSESIDSLDALDIAHYSVQGGSIRGVRWLGQGPEALEVLTDPMPEGAFYFVAKKILGQRGFRQAIPDSLLFDWLPLKVNSLNAIEDTLLMVSFNQPVDPDLTGLQVNGRTVLSTTLGADSSSVLVELANALAVGDSVTLFLQEFRNLAGTAGLNGSWTTTYYPRLRFLKLVVVDSQRLVLSFNRALDSASAAKISNYELGIAKSLPTNSSWSSQHPQSVHLGWDDAFQPGEHQLHISGLQDDTRLAIWEDEVVLFSYQPLAIVSSLVSGSHEMTLVFNQPIKAPELDQIYGDGEMGHPTGLHVSQDSLVIEWDSAWVHNRYRLELSQLVNSDVNAWYSGELSFFVEGRIPLNALVINEVLADPNPKGLLAPGYSLPYASEAEYVEIYNRGERTYSLRGVNLSGGLADSLILPPGEYAVLTANPALFADSVNLVHISGWNGLSNAGEVITLIGPDGTILDSVSYLSNWYQDSEKNGGWSLERINPLLPCSDANNWGASLSEAGVSPGFQNSILDTTREMEPPRLLGTRLEGGAVLRLLFSEMLAQGNTFVNAELRPELGFSYALSPDQRTIDFHFDTLLEPNTSFELRLDSVADCLGNVDDQISTTFLWDTQPPKVKGVVLRAWNELELIWTEPLNGWEDAVDSLVRWNRGEVQGISLDTTKKVVTILLHESLEEGTEEGFWWGGFADLEGNLSKDTTVVLQFVSAIDTVVAQSGFVTQVVFQESVQNASFLDPKHYWIQELQVHPKQVSLLGEQVVGLVWGDELPADRNYTLSFFDLYGNAGGQITTPNQILFWDQTAPQVDTAWVVDEYHSSVMFNEPVDSVSALTMDHYSRRESGATPSRIFWQTRNKVLLEWPNPFVQEVPDALEIRKVSDLWNNEMTRVQRYSLLWDTLAPRVLSLVRLPKSLVRLRFSEPVNIGQGHVEVGDMPLDSLWSHPEDGTTAYFFTSSENELLPMTLSFSDWVGNRMDTVTVTVENSNPKWVRAGFLDSVTMTAQAFPLPVSYPDLEAVRIGDSHPVSVEVNEGGFVTFRLASPLNSSDSLIFETQWPQREVQSMPVVYLPRHVAVSMVTPQLLRVNYSIENPASEVGPADEVLLLPDSLRPISVIREDKRYEQWLFTDSLKENKAYTVHVAVRYDSLEKWVITLPYTFTFDTAPPKRIDYQLVGRRQLVISFSEPLDGVSEDNIVASHEIASVRQNQDLRCITLTFSEYLDGEEVTLRVTGLKDEQGNVAPIDSLEFIWPLFSLPPEGAVYFSEIMADPTPIVELPSHEYVELYNSTDEEYWVEGWQITDGRDTATFMPFSWPGRSYLLLSHGRAENLFGDSVAHMALSGFPSLNIAGETLYLLDPSGNILASTGYNVSWHNSERAQEGGVSLEYLADRQPCPGANFWGSSSHQLGGTPGFANSASVAFADESPPSLVSAGLQSQNQLTLFFSEAVHNVDDPAVVARMDSPYRLVSSELNADGTSLVISFAPPLDSGFQVGVVFGGFEDCLGNTMPDTSLTLTIGRAPKYQELLITEVRPHPTDEVSLPLVEYIELYNPTRHHISLGEVVLTQDGGDLMLPSMTLPPSEYVVLTSTRNAPELTGFGNVLGVPSWKSLGKGGEHLQLRSANGQALHQASYPADWYGDEPEGVSFEMLNIGQPCRGLKNWAASIDPSGGSPGRAHGRGEIPTDSKGPELLQAVLSQGRELTLFFDEPIAFPLTQLFPIEINPVLPPPTWSQQWRTPNSIQLQFLSPLPKGKTYEVSVKEVADCSGNVVFDSQKALFVNPDVPKQQDIVLNELLFDPKAGASDFIEIYNTSEKHLDLTGWTVYSGLEVENGAQLNERPSGWIIGPNEYRVFTGSAALLQAFHPETPAIAIWELDDLPNFPQGAGLAILQDSLGKTFDSLPYENGWHSPFLEISKGVSLERVDVFSPTVSPKNWVSASKTSGYATPGIANSQAMGELESRDELLIADPRVFDPQSPHGSQNRVTLSYILPEPGYSGIITVWNARGSLFATILDHQLVGQRGWTSWNGLRNDGSAADVGPYWVRAEFYHPSGKTITKQIRIVVATQF